MRKRKRSGLCCVIIVKLGRIRKGDGRFEEAPDTVTEELKVAKGFAATIPAFILTRQNREEEQGWRGAPFYWPVLVAPSDTRVKEFANKAIK